VTFSIVARSKNAGMFGVAITSSSPAVAARCAHARSGAGAVATQNVTNPALGPAALAVLQRQASAREAVDTVIASEPHRDFRQLLAIGRIGPAAIRSGSRVLGEHGEAFGKDSAAAGNLLARSTVPQAMVQAFEQADAPFAHRLLTALEAGLGEGGEAGPLHSAGLLIVRNDVSWPIVDLRVDWIDHDPIASLLATWDVFGPQVEDYIRRAIDPEAAPSYSVPGDP
jgi:uncharacterized Ntn-hydrolase superfamily protein